MKSYTLAIVGAHTLYGQEIIAVIEERKFPVSRLAALASGAEAGATVPFLGEHLDVAPITNAAFSGIDLVIFADSQALSEQFAPAAQEAGALVIDTSAFFRLDPAIPLVIPEINPDALIAHGGLVACPNPVTAQLLLTLQALHQAATLTHVAVTTYQSVSDLGKEAVDELETMTRLNLNGQTLNQKIFAWPIAFNVIPQIGEFEPNGYTLEEMGIVNETRKLLALPRLPISVTCVRVPAFVGHSLAITIRTERPLSPERAREVLEAAPGVEVLDRPEDTCYPTPRETAGASTVVVGRIRTDISEENGLVLWSVADNLKRGVALNVIQIAERLVEQAS